MESEDSDPDDLGGIYKDFCSVLKDFEVENGDRILGDLREELDRVIDDMDFGIGSLNSYNSLERSLYKLGIYYEELPDEYKTEELDGVYSRFRGELKRRIKKIRPGILEKIREGLLRI